MLQLARAIEIFGEKNQPLRTAARQIRLALKEDKFSIGDLLPYVAAGESGLVASAAQRLQLDAILMWTLAQNTLKPAMRAWCRQLTPLGAGDRWYQGYCFICGTGRQRWVSSRKTLKLNTCGADNAARIGGFPDCSACIAETMITILSIAYMRKAGVK